MSTDVSTVTRSTDNDVAPAPALYVDAVAETPALFKPLQVGRVTLSHRVAMAPLTRNRADDAHVPTELMKTYYGQRASYPGSLLITEATFIAQRAGGEECVPGVWSEDQIRAWKRVEFPCRAEREVH